MIELLLNSPVRFVMVIALAVGSTLSASAACDVCNLRLTNRTGPYKIVASKDDAGSPSAAPHIRVRITNASYRPIVLGGSRERDQVRLNFVTPGSRGTKALRVSGSDRPTIVAPKGSISFEATYDYRLGKPGLYRFNVSYDGVDSNIVTYTVR